MKRLAVHYAGWGQDWLLGTLADDGHTLLFEYSPEALTQGLELSPLHLSLGPAAFGDFPPFLHRLPGLIADSLPDGWGLMLMDRVFRRKGLRHPRPLDRLAFIGDRAMGALRFIPAEGAGAEEPDWNLHTLAHESQRIIEGQAGDALAAMAIVGGSPQGARPKALVQYDAETETVSTRGDAPGKPWLVKFPAQGEHKEACAIEKLCADLARDCGIEVPPTALFDLGPQLSAFGIARFDRDRGMRVPLHSLAGLMHADFRVPGAMDYASLLRATRVLTRDEREVAAAFGRAVFNVLFHNRDDHPKNFAWRLGSNRHWRLAPAFDLTWSEGAGGQHWMDICGEGSQIGRTQLLRLARENGIGQDIAAGVIDRTAEVAGTFSQRSGDYPIRSATFKQMAKAVAGATERA